MMRSTSRRVLSGLAPIALLALLTLSGCSAAQGGATPTPTKTPRPTFTQAPPTAIPTQIPPTATASPVPPPTAAPTATQAPSAGEATAAPTTPAQQPTDTATSAAAQAEPQASATAPAPPTATAQTVAQPTATRAQPTATRPAPPTAPPTAPVSADPCAGIGGDGCKWRVTGGPTFSDTGGQEIKLQLMFLHSGIEGGQPQGSYFVVLEKDGQRLPIPDSVRSVAGAANQGILGEYNYEYALGLDKLPGNTVAGNYTLWVLDGNGERDSQNITFTVPAGLGLIWIEFDQA